jgi:hypothetical protein
MITQERLKKLFHYNPDTGILTWKPRAPTSSDNSCRLESWNTKYAGKTAGSVDDSGYIHVHVDNKKYKAHRLIIIYMNGETSLTDTDHINGDKADNRWLNLRSVTHEDNQRNRKRPSNNTSGTTGVNWVPERKSWNAIIYI